MKEEIEKMKRNEFERMVLVDERKVEEFSNYIENNLEVFIKAYKEEINNLDLTHIVCNWVKEHFNEYNKYNKVFEGEERGRYYYNTVLINSIDDLDVEDKNNVEEILDNTYTGAYEGRGNYISYGMELFRYMEEIHCNLEYKLYTEVKDLAVDDIPSFNEAIGEFNLYHEINQGVSWDKVDWSEVKKVMKF